MSHSAQGSPASRGTPSSAPVVAHVQNEVIFIHVHGRFGPHSRMDWAQDRDINQSVAVHYEHQHPSPFNVRQSWPSTEHFRLSLRDNIQQRYTEIIFDKDFKGGLPAVGRYAIDDKKAVDGVYWKDHAWEVRNCLLALLRHRYGRNHSLQCVLGALGHGIETAVFMMRESFIAIKGTGLWENGKDATKHDKRFKTDALMVDAELPKVGETLRIRKAIYRRRFIATMIHVVPHTHWVAAVFDRYHGQLYILDTLAKGRLERAQWAGAAWRQFAANLGFYSTITVIAPRLPEQPNSWACGFLALVNIQQMLRALLGKSVKSLANQHGLHGAPFDGVPYDHARTRMPALPIPSWVLGAADAQGGMRRASALLRAIMCNEIGIPDDATLAQKLGMKEVLQPSFSFARPFPGQPCTFRIEGAESWGPKLGEPGLLPLMTTFYNQNHYRYIEGLKALASPTPPNYFPSLDVPPHEHHKRTGTMDVDSLMRTDVVCWNVESQHYVTVVVDSEAEEGNARALDNITISTDHD